MIQANSKFDCIVAGGGLQAGLLALAINHYQPQASVLIIEKNNRLFGNHTWSFHKTDAPTTADWLGSIPMTTWSAYRVKFPGFEKRVGLGYCSFSSDQLSTAVESASCSGSLEVMTRTSVRCVTANTLTTDCGRTFESDLVLDCRGTEAEAELSKCGYQKFHGFEVELTDRDWPETVPTLMDATVDQADGFRFLYVLPFSRRRVLFEDTYFSNTPTVERESSLQQVRSYLHDHGFENWSLVREESGCLPMPFGSNLKPTATLPIRGGFRGGWFHAATGYSFPLAAQLANEIASNPLRSAKERIELLTRQNRFQVSFARFLNRLLFQLVSPNQRFQIFRRFYRSLNDETITRFYAHQFTKLDAARILLGSPPRGLTPFQFLKSFRGIPCPASLQ